MAAARLLQCCCSGHLGPALLRSGAWAVPASHQLQAKHQHYQRPPSLSHAAGAAFAAGSRTCSTASSMCSGSSGGTWGGWALPMLSVAAAAALAAALPGAPIVAHADSSTHQLQQTKSAEFAARHAQGQTHPDSNQFAVDDENDNDDEPGSTFDVGGAQQPSWLPDGIRHALDSLGDVYHHVESGLAGLVQQQRDEPVLTRLLAFSAALLPIIVASGLAYRWASGAPLSQAVYRMYCLLCRIDLLNNEPNFWSYLVSNTVFLFGFFTIAVLLGVVNDEVQKRAEDHRAGRNSVDASDHILILNWNEASPALLHNIAVACSSAPPPVPGQAGGLADLWAKRPVVVVLADKDKAEMDAAVQEVIRDRGFDLTVHTRKGRPFKPSHLKKVSAQDAAIVLLLHPTGVALGSDAEGMKAAAAMAFTTLPPTNVEANLRKHKRQRMIVQMPSSVPDDGNVLRSVQGTAGSLVGGSELQVQVLALPDVLLTNRIVAQTAAQAGVLTCWLDILSPSAVSSNFKCLDTPAQLQQQPYRHVRRRFSDGIVCGYVDARGTVCLNPAEAAVPGPGSKLILLTHTSPALGSSEQQEASQKVYEHAAAAAAQRLKRPPFFRYKPCHIIVTQWSERHMYELIRSFAEFAPEGSSVTFIQTSPPDRAWPARLGTTRFSFMQHPHPTSLAALSAAGFKAADSVVLGTGPGRPTDAEADARVLASLLQVQQAVADLKLSHAPHVVAPISESGSGCMALRYLDNLALKQQQEAAAREAAERHKKKGKKDTLKNKGGVGAAAEGAGVGAAAARRGGRGGGGGAAVAAEEAPQGLHKTSPTVVKPEFLIFRNITSAVLAQAASVPSYGDIISALLFSAEGEEMYLRSPAAFNIPLHTPLSWAEVEELARLRGQTALGFITTDTDSSGAAGEAGDTAAAAGGGGGGAAAAQAPWAGLAGALKKAPWAHTVSRDLSGTSVHLGLSAAEQVVLREGDWLVVLAADF